ncbi:MAG: hypothetical protein Q8M16_08495, partial [Pirellulaceae bacterium]|nr:hypothetical protein [Pirellulaceae bacterium]
VPASAGRVAEKSYFTLPGRLKPVHQRSLNRYHYGFSGFSYAGRSPPSGIRPALLRIALNRSAGFFTKDSGNGRMSCRIM